MRKQNSVPGLAAAVILFAMLAAEAFAANGMVRVRPSDGVALLVKCFWLNAGTTISGVTFHNDGSEVPFREVVVVRTPTSSLGNGTIVAQVTDIAQSSSEWAQATFAQGIYATTSGEYCVGIRVPELTGRSPAVGAVPVVSPAGCYIAAGMEGPLTVTLVDFEINLITSGASGKAQPGDAIAQEAFLTGGSPNPFNPTTTIEFGVPEEADATLRVFDVSGRIVRELLNEHVPAGIQRRVWDGRDGSGLSVAAGIYVVQLIAGSSVFQQKVVLLK